MTNASSSTTPLVSVVIPFYNIEECVDYCLDSVLAQTFADYEVVCINDGSTDGTKGALERRAQADARIRIVSTANQGLSLARKEGVGHARGGYITFVDADDVVSPFYLEALVRAMDGKRGRFVKSRAGKRQPLAAFLGNAWNLSPRVEAVSRPEAIELLLRGDITEAMWGCLAEKSIYEELAFPVGEAYEDLSTIMDILSCVDEVAVILDPIYGYIERHNSIVGVKRSSMKQVDDYLRAIERFEAGVRQHPVDEDLLSWRLALSFARCYDLLQNAERTAEAREKETMVRAFMRQNLPSLRRVASAQGLSKAQLIRYTLLARSPRLYDISFKVYGRMAKGAKR